MILFSYKLKFLCTVSTKPFASTKHDFSGFGSLLVHFGMFSFQSDIKEHPFGSVEVLEMEALFLAL